MSFLLLIPFFIIFTIFAIYSKSDLYAHQHYASLKEEKETFSTNFKELEDLDIEINYNISNDHLY